MKKSLTGVLSLSMLCGLITASQALTQFAVMNPVPSPPGPQTPYKFTNATGQFGVNPSPLDVKFQFLQAVPVIGTGIVDAKLTISAVQNGNLIGNNQPLTDFVFEVKAANAVDVFGTGVLLRAVLPNVNANLFSIGSIAFLSSEFAEGLVMESDYLIIDPAQNQTATWSYSLVNPAGFVAGGNGLLRDEQLGGNANFAATTRNIVPEPGSVAMLIGMGVSGSLALIRRRRSR
jgi:hypothetical protein